MGYRYPMRPDQRAAARDALMMQGHSAIKAEEIVIDAMRGDAFAIAWINQAKAAAADQPE